MNIALHGSYFVRNFGDTLILSIVYNWIKEINPLENIILPFIGNEAEYNEITSTQGNYRSNNLSFKKLDAFIFGPGGYFGEPPKDFLRIQYWSYRNYKRHFAWNGNLLKYKIPYIILGVGVGPISNPILNRKIVQLFQGAHFISVRDNTSKDYLKKWGINEKRINVAPDVALTLTREDACHKREKKIGLHLAGASLVKNNKTIEIGNFVLNKSKDYEIEFIEDQSNQFPDNNIISNKTEMLKLGCDDKTIRYANPQQLIADIKKFSLIITTKLHMGIVAYALGVPVISIPTHTKIIRFYEQIKRTECCIEITALNEGQLNNAFDFCLNSKIDNRIINKEAMMNRKFLEDFLKTIKQTAWVAPVI